MENMLRLPDNMHLSISMERGRREAGGVRPDTAFNTVAMLKNFLESA
jgi:hypothetical protein